MLYLIVQDHTPENCPQRDRLPPETLYDKDAGVDIRFVVADVPGHRLTFLVETESYDALQSLLEPGRTRCTTNISPVTAL